jgi:hypothetical protein
VGAVGHVDLAWRLFGGEQQLAPGIEETHAVHLRDVADVAVQPAGFLAPGLLQGHGVVAVVGQHLGGLGEQHVGCLEGGVERQGIDPGEADRAELGAADGVVVAGPAEVREHQRGDQQGEEVAPVGPREGALVDVGCCCHRRGLLQPVLPGPCVLGVVVIASEAMLAGATED